jgi:dihydrofolate reductase
LSNFAAPVRRIGEATTEHRRNAMGRIVVTEFVSLDGVMDDPGGSEGTPHGGWTFKFDRSPEGDKFKLDELMQAEAQLLGRVTYSGFAAAWPNYTDEMGFAERMNTMPKYVVSKTLTDPSWANTTVLSGDPVEEITALKQRIEGDILVGGSASLVHLLTANALVDEFRLMVFPVVLGSGKRLWADSGTATRFAVVDDRRVGDVQLLVLRPAGTL